MATTKRKPKKPHADFPLTAHRNGQWCKKVRGKLWYFGTWDDPQAALEEYLRQKDDLQAGRQPGLRRDDRLDLAELCNAFLERSEERVKAGDITPRTFGDYRDVCAMMLQHFGRTTDPEKLHPEQFARFRSDVAAKYSPSRLTKAVTVTKMVFKWAKAQQYITDVPAYGADFKGASKKVQRKHRAERGKRLFSAAEILQLLMAADPIMAAMILLSVNSGFGNNDLATLPLDAVDLDAGWIDYPRPKTGVERRVPLWPETIAALREAIDQRPKPARTELADRVFLTRWGNSWVPEDRRDNEVSVKFRQLLEKCDLYREGRGFYALRHTFETIGGDCRDQVAVNHIMGHVDDSMAAVYREHISERRLQAVTDHVRAWLLLSVVKSGSHWTIMGHPSSYWTGDAWSTDVKSAVKFESEEEARSRIAEQRAVLLASPFAK